MAKYSKETRRIHKERIRQILVRDTTLTLSQLQQVLKDDKKDPLPLALNYVANLVRDINSEVAEKIKNQTIYDILTEVDVHFREVAKQLWDIIHGPRIRYAIVQEPDINNPGKFTKKLDKLKITTKERIEAMRELNALVKEHSNKMLIVGNPKGSEKVNLSLLGDRSITNNITQVNINGTPEDIKKERLQLEKDIESIERQLAKYRRSDEDGEGHQDASEPIEAKEAEIISDGLSGGESPVQGDASDNA